MAGPDPREAAARLAAEIPAPVVGVLDRTARRRARRVPRRRIAARRAAAVANRRTGTSPPMPGRPRSSSLFPGAVYENRFGTVAVRRDGDGVRDHDLPARARLRGSPAAPPGGVRRRPRGGPRAPRLHGQRAGLGRPGHRRRRRSGRGPGRPVRRAAPTSRPAPCARSETRWRGSTRTRCGWSGRSASPPRSTSRSRPATLAAIAANAGLVAHVSGERVGAELSRLLEAPRPSVGLRLAADTGLLAVIVPELAAQRGIAQNKVPGEDLWDHTLRSVDAAPAERPDRAAGRAAPRRRQAGDARRRPVPPPRRGRGRSRPRRSSAGFGSRRPRSRTSPTSSATTCSRSRQTRPGRPSAGSSAGSVASTSTPCSSCGGPTTSGAACRRTTRPRRRSAPGSTPSSRRGHRSTGARWPSTATT